MTRMREDTLCETIVGSHPVNIFIRVVRELRG
jgi:hypothetical protein